MADHGGHRRLTVFQSYLAVFVLACIIQVIYVYNSTKNNLVFSLTASHDDQAPKVAETNVAVAPIGSNRTLTWEDCFEKTSSSSSTSCMLGLEKYLHPLFGRWLDDDVPMLMHTVLIDGTYYIMLVTFHLRDDPEWRNGVWFCNQNETATVVKSFKEHKSLLLECRIPNNGTLHTISTLVNSTQGIQPQYDTRPLVKCDQVAAIHPEPAIAPDVKLGACLQFSGEWSRNAITQWVEYHRLIGIQHFWIYVNEAWNLTNLPQRPYVTYIPYDYGLYDFVNQTRSKFMVPHFFQHVQNMHCLYLAKQLKLDWIAQLDVDEYFVVSDADILKKYSEGRAAGKPTTPVLTELLGTIKKPDKIGGIAAQSIPFGRNVAIQPIPTEEQLKTRLLMDYVWKSDYDPRKFPWQRHKQIINVKTVTYFSIHFIHGGKLERRMDPDQLRLHHYKRADDQEIFRSGMFKSLTQETILPDNFREPLLMALGRGDEVTMSGSFVKNTSTVM